MQPLVFVFEIDAAVPQMPVAEQQAQQIGIFFIEFPAFYLNLVNGAQVISLFALVGLDLLKEAVF